VSKPPVARPADPAEARRLDALRLAVATAPGGSSVLKAQDFVDRAICFEGYLRAGAPGSGKPSGSEPPA
jgi:hypothetical protein